MLDSERLDLFIGRAQELVNTRLVQSGGLDASLSLKFHYIEGLSLTVQNPDEELLRSFLVTFRHFVSKDEPVFVPRVYNLLWMHLQADAIRLELAVSRKHWQDTSKVGGVDLIFDGARVSPDRLLDLWINGQYFHSDERKRAAIEAMGPLGLPLARHGFLDRLVVATRHVIHLRNVIVRARSDGVLHV